ncbi:MAG: YitT family protein [Christensenellaceae bacterium]|nr:YitT family protein [Christensenellaceae bacterium]
MGEVRILFKEIRLKNCIAAFFSGSILAFGLFNIHAQADITEGGTLGLTLLLEHWFALSPAVSGFLLNALCYFIGWKTLGKNFIAYSAAATIGFSLSYRIFEMIGPLFAIESQLLAAILGAVFVGCGCGFAILAGGAPSGDDALAMSLSKILKIRIEKVYLATDLVVLFLSLSYIPIGKILYSLLTVVLSGQIIGLIQKLKKTDQN